MFNTADESRFSNLEIDADPTPAKAAPAPAPAPVVVPEAPQAAPPAPAPVPLVQLLTVAAVQAARPGVSRVALLEEIRTTAGALPEGAEKERLRRMYRTFRDTLVVEAAAPAPSAEVALAAITTPAPAPAPAPVAFPFPAPADFQAKTSNGTPMGPRMARFYGALHGKGIKLYTMSTDSCVQGYLPKLDVLAAEVDVALAKSEGALHNELAELRDDVRAIMGRVPANRSTGVTRNGAAVQTAPAPTAVVDSQRVLAVGEHTTGTTGAVVFWNGNSGSTVGAYDAACEAEGIDAKLRAAAPSREVAFGRACKREESKTVDVVASKARATWVRVERGMTHDGAVTLGQQLQLQLNSFDTVEVSKRQDSAWVPDVNQGKLQHRVREAFGEARTTFTAGDVTDWLVGLVERLGGVPLRGRGGVYFIPAAGVETYQKAMRVVSSIAAGAAYEIPALKAGATVDAVTAALAAEVASLCDDTQAEIEAAIGTRAARNRIAEMNALIAKVGQYEALFGVKLNAAREKIGKVVVALSEVTTRTANLEIE